MDDLARVKFDPLSATPQRAAALGRVTVMGAGRWHAPLAGRPAARFVAVRGRRGVGKSTIAANLAIALAGMRSRVVLIDLDLQHPTQHELFGIAAPVSGLNALLHEEIDTIEQALIPTAVRNLYLVSAEGTIIGPGSANKEQQHRLLSQVWELDADIVIADVGTDTGDSLIDLFELGALRLVVSGPDPQSIRRAYNFFKEEVIREIEHVAGGTTEGWALLEALNSDPALPMSEILARVPGRPNIRAALEQALAGFGGRLVGNHIHNAVEADLMHASSRLMADYLGIAVPVWGVLDSSLQIGATRVSGRPLLLGSGIDRNVRLFHSMAEQLLMDDHEAEAPRCVARPLVPELISLPTDKPMPKRPEKVRKTVAENAAENLSDIAAENAAENAADIAADIAAHGDGDPLPASLGSYMRRHPRHPVDWHALYRSDSGQQTEVRIIELSLSGASVETMPGLPLGDRGRLIFAQVADQPAIPVTVLDARRPLGRAALRFEGADEVCARMAALAAGVAS